MKCRLEEKFGTVAEVNAGVNVRLTVRVALFGAPLIGHTCTPNFGGINGKQQVRFVRGRRIL